MGKEKKQKTHYTQLFLSAAQTFAKAASLMGCNYCATYSAPYIGDIATALTQEFGHCTDKQVVWLDCARSVLANTVGASWAAGSVAALLYGTHQLYEGLEFMLATETPCVIFAVTQNPLYSQGWSGGTKMDMRMLKQRCVRNKVVVYAPSCLQDIYDYTLKAFHLSTLYRMPVLMVCDEILAQLHETVILKRHPKLTTQSSVVSAPYFGKREKATVAAMPYLGQGLGLCLCADTYQEQWLQEKLTHYEKECVSYSSYEVDHCDVLLVSYGMSARRCRDIVEYSCNQNIQLGLVQVGSLQPFPGEYLKKLCKKRKKVVVCEMGDEGLRAYIQSVCEQVQSCSLLNANISTEQLFSQLVSDDEA